MLASAARPESAVRLKSMECLLGLCEFRVLPTQVSPHRNGISKSGPLAGETATVLAANRARALVRAEPRTAGYSDA